MIKFYSVDGRVIYHLEMNFDEPGANILLSLKAMKAASKSSLPAVHVPIPAYQICAANDSCQGYKNRCFVLSRFNKILFDLYMTR